MMVVCRDRIMVTVLWRWEHGSGSEQGDGREHGDGRVDGIIIFLIFQNKFLLDRFWDEIIIFVVVHFQTTFQIIKIH